MQVWKRRLAFVLAVGTGTLGLTLSTAGAQTPPDFPTFPTFPDFPDFTISPPPTMPPSTSPPSTSPPPTMPPPTFPPFPTFPTFPPPPTMPPPTSTPPPTMPPTSSPPTSVPSFEDRVAEIFEELLDQFDSDTRDALEEIRDAFFD